MINQNPSLDRLVAFEKATWPVEEQASIELLEQRSQNFGQGIFLLTNENGVDVAQFSACPKQYEVKDIKTYEQMAELPFSPESTVLWGLNLAIHPEYQGKGYAVKVVDAGLEWFAAAGYTSFAAGVTCHKLADLVRKGEVSGAIEYMQKGMNPALRTFVTICKTRNWTLKIFDPTPGYWVIDEGSLGYGVIIQVEFC